MSSTQLRELRTIRQGLIGMLTKISNDLRAMQGRAEAAGRSLTPAEVDAVAMQSAKFDAHEAELGQVEREIAEMERDALPQHLVAQLPARPRVASPTPIAASGGLPQTSAHRFAEPTPRRFTDMFHSSEGAGRTTHEFASFGDFARAVASGGDQRLIRNVTSTTMEGASAGFMVPQSFVSALMDESLAMEVFRPLANVVPVPTGNIVIGGFESTDRTGGKRAGLYLDWNVGEAEPLFEQKPKARKITAAASKATIFCRVSTELLEDAPNFDRELSRAMVSALAAGLDLAFLGGTGAGQPLGVLNAPAAIVVAKESGQAAGTVLLQNLAKMIGRLAPESYRRSVWYINPTVVPTLYQLAYTVKNVAGTENVGGALVQPITVGPAGELRCFGLPMIVTDAASPLSSQGDIILCDPSRYLVALRQDVRLARDLSAYFGSDEVAFRLTMRLDGMPVDGAPTKLRDGTNTVSAFVVLGAR